MQQKFAASICRNQVGGLDAKLFAIARKTIPHGFKFKVI
jgi:hypothetical protein